MGLYDSSIIFPLFIDILTSLDYNYKSKERRQYMRLAMVGKWRTCDVLTDMLAKDNILLQLLTETGKKPTLIIFWQADEYLAAQELSVGLKPLVKFYGADVLLERFPAFPISKESIKAKVEVSPN
jgi:hypothetical protein